MSAFGGISIHTHTHTCTHARTHAHTHTHIRTHTHTPTHTHSHTHHTTPHTFPRIISLFCPSPVADAFAPAQGMMDVRHERSSGLFSPRIIASPCHRHAIAVPLPCNCQVSSPWLRHVIATCVTTMSLVYQYVCAPPACLSQQSPVFMCVVSFRIGLLGRCLFVSNSVFVEFCLESFLALLCASQERRPGL